jgi:hypothetical protein
VRLHKSFVLNNFHEASSENPRQYLIKFKFGIARRKAMKSCGYCKQGIEDTAVVCHHCQRHQNRFFQNPDKLILLFNVIVAVFALGFSAWQAKTASDSARAAIAQAEEARKQRVSAEEAARQAMDALCRALDVGYKSAYVSNLLEMRTGHVVYPFEPPNFGKLIAEQEKSFKEERDRRCE